MQNDRNMRVEVYSRDMREEVCCRERQAEK